MVQLVRIDKYNQQQQKKGLSNVRPRPRCANCTPYLTCYVLKAAPENPKAWRALADFLETGIDNKAFAEALQRCVEIAESKGNFGRSRPVRIRLSEVREAAGDRRGALAALKDFTLNPTAMAATTAPPVPSGPKTSAATKAAAEAVKRDAEAIRDAENTAMKDRSTRLFMEINADLVPDAAPPPPLPSAVSAVARTSRTAAPVSPKKPEVTTVAQAAANAAKAATSGRKITGWVRSAASGKGANGRRGVALPTLEEVRALGDGERLEALSEHCARLEESGDPAARRIAAVAVAKSLAASNAEGPWVEAQLRELMGGAPAAREGALLSIHAMCEVAGPGAEPYVVSLLPLLLLAHGAQAAPVRAAAVEAGAAAARALNPFAMRVVLPAIKAAVESDAWRVKAGALEFVAIMAESSPAQVAQALPEIVPLVSHQVGCVMLLPSGLGRGFFAEPLMKSCSIHAPSGMIPVVTFRCVRPHLMGGGRGGYCFSINCGYRLLAIKGGRVHSTLYSITP